MQPMWCRIILALQTSQAQWQQSRKRWEDVTAWIYDSGNKGWRPFLWSQRWHASHLSQSPRGDLQQEKVGDRWSQNEGATLKPAVRRPAGVAGRKIPGKYIGKDGLERIWGEPEGQELQTAHTERSLRNSEVRKWIVLRDRNFNIKFKITVVGWGSEQPQLVARCSLQGGFHLQKSLPTQAVLWFHDRFWQSGLLPGKEETWLEGVCQDVRKDEGDRLWPELIRRFKSIYLKELTLSTAQALTQPGTLQRCSLC